MNIRDYMFLRDDQKDKKLRSERGIGFEDIKNEIMNGGLRGIIQNPSQNHDNQKLIIVIINSYPFAVPCIILEDSIILKTIFPCRKYK